MISWGTFCFQIEEYERVNGRGAVVSMTESWANNDNL